MYVATTAGAGTHLEQSTVSPPRASQVKAAFPIVWPWVVVVVSLVVLA